MVFFTVEDIGFSQIVFIVGLPSIALGLYLQLKSLKKAQREDAAANRAAITKEILDNREMVLSTLESKLQLIQVASVVSKDDIQALREQFIDLKSYVEEMDKDGTIEWQKVKPFIIKRMDDLEKKIEELYSRSNENATMQRSRMDQEDLSRRERRSIKN